MSAKVPRGKVLDRPVRKQMAKNDRRSPIAEQNLKEIKKLLEDAGLCLEAGEAETMLAELSQSRK
jgi:hypothetical protein